MEERAFGPCQTPSDVSQHSTLEPDLSPFSLLDLSCHAKEDRISAFYFSLGIDRLLLQIYRFGLRFVLESCLLLQSLGPVTFKFGRSRTSKLS